MSSKSSTEESICDNDSECSEEGVDPRVQVELEKLNSATNEINRLEVGLDDARSRFRQLLCDTTVQVDSLGKKLGSCVEKARPYYDARIKSKEALLEAQKAAVRFERANSAHTAAKEMVFLAEEGLKTEGRTFDHAWQEMLNHATMRVNETEMERTTTELEHRKTSQMYQDAERRVQQLQKDLKRSITKSSLNARRNLLMINSITSQHRFLLLPYFELKSNYNQQMEEQKQRVKRLESQVAQAKASYAEALRNLEQISDEIHKIRNHEMFGFTDPLGVRGLGVGAESPHKSTKNIRDSEKISQAPKRKKPTKQPQQHHLKQQQQLSTAEKEKRDAWFDSDSGEEYLTIPNKLGPDASPVMPQRSKESGTLPQYLGLSGLSGDSETRMQAVAKLEEEVLKDAKTTRLEAERRPSLATSTPSCNTTPKKAPRNPFLPLTNPFQPQNRQNGDPEPDPNQTWTAINLGESSSDNSPSPVKTPADGSNHCGNTVDFPYRPLLEQTADDKGNGRHIITPLTDDKTSCDGWGRKMSEETVPDGGEEVWTEVSLNDPETPTTSNLFKKVSFFNTNFSCRPRNSSTDDDRQSSVELPTPPQSARGSISLQGTPLKQRMKLESGLVNWISRSSAGEEQMVNYTQGKPPVGSRRQSLDTLLWNPTSERVKDILNQGIMMLNISSLTERRSSEPRTDKATTLPSSTLNPMTGIEQHALAPRTLKKVPSPLEKSLTYLNAEDDSASDNDSLHSMDMLTDDQISCLMHEPNLREVCQDVLGTPISEVLPGYPTNKV